jgi:hypothetical protein
LLDAAEAWIVVPASSCVLFPSEGKVPA